MKRLVSIIFLLALICCTSFAQHHLNYADFKSTFLTGHTLNQMDSILYSYGYTGYRGLRYSNGDETHIWGNGCTYSKDEETKGDRIVEGKSYSEFTLILRDDYQDNEMIYRFYDALDYHIFMEDVKKDGFTVVDEQRGNGIYQAVLMKDREKATDFFVFQSVYTVLDKYQEVSFRQRRK